jgi:NAD(P)-dependent dehydrogenase (short-subunit alcohol dehydrogenase family)
MPDGASIILNASMAASQGGRQWSVYSATKAAVRSFARTWTMGLKERRIRVNAVSPGFIEAPLWHASETGEGYMKNMQTISSSVPLGRFGTADGVAKVVVFLASDESSYVTGIELFVDGGFAQI